MGLHNSLAKENQTEVLESAIRRHAKPEVINSDQGSQYTCAHWVDALKGLCIQISMDGRARCLDNIWIERFWCTLKQEYIYRCPEDNAVDLRAGISQFIDYYNNKRPHQGIGHTTPAFRYAAG